MNQVCEELLQQQPQISFDGRGVVPAKALARIYDIWSDALLGVVLFGSAARGEATSSSDIDLLLVLKPEIPLNRGLYLAWERELAPEFSKLSRLAITPQFVHLPVDGILTAGSLWFETSLDGVVLREQGLAISNFLSQIRHAIAKGEIQRAESHGHPYWIKSKKNDQGAA